MPYRPVFFKTTFGSNIKIEENDDEFKHYFVSVDFWTSTVSRFKATKGIFQTSGIERK